MTIAVEITRFKRKIKQKLNERFFIYGIEKVLKLLNCERDCRSKRTASCIYVTTGMDITGPTTISVQRNGLMKRTGTKSLQELRSLYSAMRFGISENGVSRQASEQRA